jgi:hypothetical protein
VKSDGLIFSGLCGFISQKIELFIITAVRTSNPTTGIQFTWQTKRISVEISTAITLALYKIE